MVLPSLRPAVNPGAGRLSPFWMMGCAVARAAIKKENGVSVRYICWGLGGKARPFARVGNRADAEDLTAEVFLAAHRPLKITATVAEVRAYLRATARTVLAAHWRATLGREITSIDDLEDVAPDSADAISTAPERVHAVLATLPAQYSRILELRFLQGRSVQDSATDMGVSVANAKVLQHRALRLAAQVNEEGER